MTPSGVESQVGDPKNGSQRSWCTTSEGLRLLSVLGEGAPAAIEGANQCALMTSVPENWIPFIPAQMPVDAANNRKIQLQRAVMQRILEGSQEGPPRIGTNRAVRRPLRIVQ